MLWIECENGKIVNMNNVIYIDIVHVDDKSYALLLKATNTISQIPIAHGSKEQCKIMKYRIYTYFTNHNYNDRKIIRHDWLTHKLPE